jgi:transposase
MRRSDRSRLRRRDLGPAAHRHREAFTIGLPDGVRVYLAAGRTDLRRGIDGLAAQIQTVLREDPFSGHLFIFRGRAAHTIKVLMYDGSGFLLMQKRLTEGKFIWPSPADGIVTISRAQMSLLIDGLDWRSAKARSVAKPLFIV